MKTKINSTDDDSRNVAPEHIARLLTHATQQLDERTVAGLRRARNIALEMQPPVKPAFALSSGHGVRWLLPHFHHQWLAMAILLAALLLGGVTYLKHAHENDLSHLDAAILSDDLPLEVFVD